VGTRFVFVLLSGIAILCYLAFSVPGKEVETLGVIGRMFLHHMR
jgi:hypothetical protein